MIRSINIVLVDTEYDYNKFVPEDYRNKYTYEESKMTLPWLLIFPENTEDSDGIIKDVAYLTFDKAPDFTAVVNDPDGAFEKTADNKFLKVDFSKIKNCLMLEVNNEIYPDKSFDGKIEAIVFDQDFANYPDVKPVLTAKIEPLTVDQAQYIADLWVRSQGDSALARLLDYFIGKCFDVKIGNSFNGDFNADFDVQQ